MIKIKKILCPVDFFAGSDNAVKYAALLAANYEARVKLLHVIEPIWAEYDYPINTGDLQLSMKSVSDKELRKMAAKLEIIGLTVEREVRTGEIAGEIKQVIDRDKPELVVMGSHGRRAFERWLLGSVAERLIRQCPVPLLVVPANQKKKTTALRLRRILVTTDFSEGSPEAINYAFSIAQENQSKITLLHVVPYRTVELGGQFNESIMVGAKKELERLVPADAREWCDVQTRLETGEASRQIEQILEKERIDLLVMNIHGKGFLNRALLGSTAERVVRSAACPMLLIPPAMVSKKLKAKKKTA